MRSQVEAAAVTEEVSLMAVPAKTPKAVPLPVSKPSTLPSIGKKIAASTLKKKMTEMACATSSSFASMTGAVAAIADPPQIDEPTPTRVAMFPEIRSARCKPHASSRAVAMVHTIMGSDCLPVFKMTPRFKPKPSRTTAACRMYLEVKRIPASALPLFVQTIVSNMPPRMASTAPPISGKRFPSSHAGTASAKQTRIPGPVFLIPFIYLPLFARR